MDTAPQGSSARTPVQSLGSYSMLGLPSYILSHFALSMVAQANKNPRLAKAVRIASSLAAAVVAIAFYFAMVGDNLRSIWKGVARCFMKSVRISSDDKLRPAVLRWIGDRTNKASLPEVWGESLPYAKRSGRSSSAGDSADGQICYTEASGVQYFWHGRRLFRVDVIHHKSLWLHSNWEYVISTFGFSNQPVKDLLSEAWETYKNEHASRITDIYYARKGEWEWLAEKPVRPLATVDLDDAVKKDLVNDLERYLSPDAEARYVSHGIPYRRGYLLHGPPGTGKTSLSLAIAGHFDLAIQVVSLADPDLTDAKLAQLFGSLDKPSVLLLEDIDSAGLEREVATKASSGEREGNEGDQNNAAEGSNKTDTIQSTESITSKTSITLSGLLNALDGVAAPDGCIIIMTTNHPKNLDPALIRPGRVDYKVAFSYIDNSTARKMFIRLFSHEKRHDLTELSCKFASKLPEGQISPADLQGYLLEHLDFPELAVSELESWVEKTLKERQNKQTDKEIGNASNIIGEKKDEQGFEQDAESVYDDPTLQNVSTMLWLKLQATRAYSVLRA